MVLLSVGLGATGLGSEDDRSHSRAVVFTDTWVRLGSRRQIVAAHDHLAPRK